METKQPTEKLAFIYFGLALSVALIVLFVPNLPYSLKVFFVLIVFFLLGLMGKSLDHKA